MLFRMSTYIFGELVNIFCISNNLYENSVYEFSSAFIIMKFQRAKEHSCYFFQLFRWNISDLFMLILSTAVQCIALV